MADRGVDKRGDGPAPISFATLALGVAGAGVLFLGLTTLAVALLPLPPVGKAVVALVGVVLTITAMGVASNRITARAIRAEYGDDPHEGPDERPDEGPDEHPAEASGPAEGDDQPRRADGLG
ncbi:hypothetical protein [Rhodococcus sp. IEGM 1408]|uniref:hypothetical protein n=1 Tax=Rhodococcus sp. IEGM 1408 TaxID=3082220 RepID=UPI0029542A7C|nr:hypothetical protein [Rhodococcus sp. IEGM 1408]MDV8001768.1 hypothetical protein [Rhodococcus sp. IEGM 1408]